MSNRAQFGLLGGSSLFLILNTGCTLIFGIEEGQLGTGAAGGGDGGSVTSTGAANAGGGGGNGNGGTAAGAGGEGGGVGGQGGQGGGVTCTALDPFDVFTPAEINGQTLDDENIVVATRPNDNRVHIAVQLGNGQIAARTVRTNAVIEESPIVIFPPTLDTINRRAIGGYTTANEFRVIGLQNNSPGEFVFPANSDIGDPNVSFFAYPTPTGALSQCQELRSISVHLGNDGVARFAASCKTAGTPQQAVLFGGRTNGVVEFLLGPVPLDVNGEVPADMLVRTYAKFGSEHVIITDVDDFVDSAPTLRRGADTAALTAKTPIQTPPNQSMLFIGGPATPDDKLFMAALHADPDSLFTAPNGGYATGVIGPNDLDALTADPIATIGHEFLFTTLEEIAVPFSVKANGPQYVGGAVSNFDISKPARVRLFLWDSDGTPLVVGFPVFESSVQGQILTGTAAAAGFGSLLSLWNEQTGGVYSMRGARVQCTGN